VNGWTAVLQLADLIGTAAVVVRAYRADPLDGTPHDLERRDLRQLRVAEAGVDGALFAVIILGRSSLGFWGALGLVNASLVAGRACRLALAFHTVLNDPVGRRLQGRATALATVLTVAVPVIVGVSALSEASHRTRAQRDSSLFGVHVFAREVDVPTRVLTHPPAAADSGMADGIAVPVEKYQAETGGWLVLLVPHELTCRPAEVLLARDATLGAIDVAVLYRPGPLTRMPDGYPRGTATPTALPDTATPVVAPVDTPPAGATASPSPPPWPLPASVCRTDAAHGLPVHSTVQVSLPTDLLPPGVSTPNTVRDTGAGGAARDVTGIRR
jgi:hypothetical protein